MLSSDPPQNPDLRKQVLADPDLRTALERMVKRKVAEADVEDVVQSTLSDAIAAQSAPSGSEELRRWVFGIARHKIADHHRKTGRLDLSDEPPEIEAPSGHHDAHDLARWLQREMPGSSEAEKTLEWMAREADGEPLEAIAAEERLPAPRVRQRVSRLRRFLKTRWAAALAGISALALMAGGVWYSRRADRDLPGEKVLGEDPLRVPRERARVLRERALERCRASDWSACLDGLDAARALDPVGDEASAIIEARAAARAARNPPAPSAEAPSPVPSASAPPRPRPRPAPTSDLSPTETERYPDKFK